MVTGSKYAVTAAREAAYAGVKRIATQGLGWLAHAPEHGTAQFYRPDFWNMVVSSAVAKLEWKIQAARSGGDRYLLCGRRHARSDF